MTIELHCASRTQLIATSPHLVIRIVDGHRTTVEDYELLDEVARAAFPEPEIFGVFHVVCHGNSIPPPEVRRRGAEVMEHYADRSCVVIALLGLGFWASTLRAALNTFATVLRRSTIHAEGSVEAAAERLAREIVGLDAASIVEIYEHLHKHMLTL